MQAVDLIIFKKLYMDHGYVFVHEGKEAEKVKDITSSVEYPAIIIQVTTVEGNVFKYKSSDSVFNVVIS